MTPTDTPAPPAPIPAEATLTADEYHVLLNEWADRFPRPTWAEIRDDYRYLRDRQIDGTLDRLGWRDGLTIAVYGGQVVGTDTNYLRLQLNKARELNVHPRRIAISTAPPEDIYGPAEEVRRCPSCGSSL